MSQEFSARSSPSTPNHSGKALRLKQAKQEAEADIKAYADQCERQFRAKEAQVSEANPLLFPSAFQNRRCSLNLTDYQHDGQSDDAVVRIGLDKASKLKTLEANVSANKAEVIAKLLEISMQVEPRVHVNYRAN